MAVPFKVENLTVVAAAAQIRRMGARHVPRDSTAARHVYYEARSQTWIVLTANPDGTRKLSYSKGCAC